MKILNVDTHSPRDYYLPLRVLYGPSAKEKKPFDGIICYEKSSDVCDENTQLGEHQLQLLQQERQLQKQRQVQQEQQLRLQQHLLRQQITHKS